MPLCSTLKHPCVVYPPQCLSPVVDGVTELGKPWAISMGCSRQVVHQRVRILISATKTLGIGGITRKEREGQEQEGANRKHVDDILWSTVHKPATLVCERMADGQEYRGGWRVRQGCGGVVGAWFTEGWRGWSWKMDVQG